MALAEPITVAGGLRIRLRPITPADRDELLSAFHALSDASRLQRFISPPHELSPAMLTYLTDVDGINHAALVAVAEDEPGRPGIGVARYVKLADDPETAEVAVTVLDRYQGRGVGTALMEALAELAVVNGVRSFCGYVASGNPILGVVHDAGARITPSERGVMRVSVDLPADRETVRAWTVWTAQLAAAADAPGADASGVDGPGVDGPGGAGSAARTANTESASPP